ncbi:molybdate ABC transporter substrate-binding protein [Nocardioides sp.]|uniref:molybdate ABC transporter substrate-binding protein n=1 Tax=Nocardioides sp. TaxID=35761 RepID=UPI0027243B80|nr:molybdate ABC transporter substrate-binding protein [Nocardioides sp.]MDO9454669.1 molybdate ABC transporter substrate-binding protein [Nocardioides sp.]
MTRRLLPYLALLLLAPALVACGGDDDDTTVTVYAAASLKKTFEQLASDFEADHDGVTVELVFGGSSDLVSQIQNGAEADVFASADTANMDKLTADDLQGQDPQDFATNTLQIAVPPDNPADVSSLQDLADPALDLVLCAPDVPCGAAAQGVAEAAGLTLDPDSEEQSVTDVLGKITSGQGDAGLVYVTDVLAAGDDVMGVEFPESADVVNTYPITTVEDSDESDLAQEFVELVLSDSGQKVLTDAGFGAP